MKDAKRLEKGAKALAPAVMAACAAVCLGAAAQEKRTAECWPEPTAEMKPWAYNWWMASAVDEQGLEFQCSEMEAKGFGGFHVIPIYGANGPDKCYRAKWRELLSPDWVEAWNMAARKAKEHNLGIDLTMGSGWCFGGPWITPELGASSGQKVKRAGPGGAGLMLDPFSAEAMRVHVAQFEPLFGKDGKAERPRAFYHDSYEYYGAQPRDKSVDIDSAQLECFSVWTRWCRENGYLTRNEAHGAPSNWLDFYGIADIPETEMFGKKDRDILISKFASSAAHVKGTTLVSAETCTWVDEHFCERPAEIKEFIDLLFLSGVNHIFYHGLCYSPVEAVWPGWCFYASLEMNPRNPIWREMASLNAYVTRCQSMFQTWQPDNDLLIVWDPAPFRAKEGNWCRQMSVHGTDWFYGENIGKMAKKLYDAGYCFDYVSPRQLKELDLGRYAEILDPEKGGEPEKARAMPFTAQSGILATRWKKDGRTMYFVVNVTSACKEITAEKPFTVMNPLTGMVRETLRLRIEPKHSRFIIGEGFSVADAAAKNSEVVAQIVGPWRVTPVEGGPAMPAERVIKKLDPKAGWEAWDDAFSGMMCYMAKFDCASERGMLDLGDVREIARVRLNGLDLGVRFMRPYTFYLPPGLLKEKGNTLEVEVTSLGANRLRWNDTTGVNWKYFTDANMKSPDYKDLDASKWVVMPSGLLGPVEILK